MKALERDSNYLKPHGSYMEDWRDQDGIIWRYLLEVPPTAAFALLSVSLMVQEQDSYLSELIRDEKQNYLSWLRVGNKDIVIYNVDNNGNVYALTNRDGRFCAIVGDIARIERYAGNRHPFLDTERRLMLALQTLQYDMKDSDLHLRCLLY